jgi:hypothetical protein
MSTSLTCSAPPTGYDPSAPLKPDCRIGRLLVRGGDFRASVYRGYFPYATQIRVEDNAAGLPAGQSPSAFERAVGWAELHPDGTEGGLP